MLSKKIEFVEFLKKEGLSSDIISRYPPELERLGEQGYPIFSLSKNSSTDDVNKVLRELVYVGGTPVIYDVGIGGERVPNLRNPKNYDSAELVIRVIKLYLLFIGKANGSANQISSIIPQDNITYEYLKFLESLKRQYNKLFEIFEAAKKPSPLVNTEVVQQINSSTKNLINGKNIILYGVPGSGKSFFVKKLVDDNFLEVYFERVTFFPDYSNADFVGQIFPKVHNDNIIYEFKPGPFTKILAKALKDPNNHYFLIIEELNRGNAPLIFGDLFQLLDRNGYGESVYPISNNLIQEYLTDYLGLKQSYGLIKIPFNLSFYATMNTSDQNIFVLDNAFKRRWEFQLIKNDISTFKNAKNLYVPNTNISWFDFHLRINKKILKNLKDFGSLEDKQIGPFFIDESYLSPMINDKDQQKMNKFAYKVLDYLWNDVAKYNRELWFGHIISSFDELIETYFVSGFTKFPNNLLD
jgi:5-methylcytosine-specific restriction endonuclease McrBC GTP-binding regulatory subunit McrB